MVPHAPAGEARTGWRERLQALGHLPPLLRMVWETSPRLAAASLVLRLVSALLPVALLWVAKLIIDEVVRLASGQPAGANIWILLGIEAALAVAADGLTRATALSDSLLGDLFTNRIGLQMMEHAGKLDLIALEDPAFYDKLERARRQTTSRLGLLAAFAVICQQSLTLLSLSIGVVSFSPWFLPVLVVAVVPLFLGEAQFAVLTYSLLYRRTPERRELDYLRFLGASSASAKELKIFGLGKFLTARAAALFERFYAENRALARKRATVGMLLNTLPVAAYYSAYAWIVYRTIHGSLSIGDLTFLTAAFARSRGNLERIFLEFSFTAEQALYLGDLFDFFRTEPSIVSQPGALPAPRPIREGYEFRNVSFAYPGAAKPALHNVSFRIGAGERVALIGENGAGKTTIVKLLARLYDPTSGSILLDGVDLRDYDVEQLRAEIGVIFQDYMRYDMLVSENIGIGRIDNLHDESRIRESARKSRADAVIAALPGGFGQMLGRRFDGGMDLSSGQWQKIALARAYMRDAQVLILDEPTATLDARAEFEVFQRFAELTRDRIAVLISHRFSTVRMADRILVLEGGELVEQGTHAELLAARGRYAELFELQAAGYR